VAGRDVVSGVSLPAARRGIAAFAAVAALLLVLPSALGGAGMRGTRTFVVRTGPFTLDAYQVRLGTSFPAAPGVRGDLVAMHARVVDAAGRPVALTRVMLHHVLYSNEGRFAGDRRDGTCPAVPRQRFYGRGEDDRALSLPRGYGYPLRPTDRWRMNWMLMNHRAGPRTVYIEYRATVRVGGELTPVTPYWLDVSGCRAGGGIFSVPGGAPAGAIDRRTAGWRVPRNGLIVEAGAHLHGGAEGMALTQPACGNRPLLDSRPLYGMPSDQVYRVQPVLHEPGPIATSVVRSQAGIPVPAGQLLRAQSRYDASRPHAAAMAMLHVYLAPARGTVPRCAPLPSDETTLLPKVPGRRSPPSVAVPLTGLDAGGRAVPITRPGGPVRRLAAGTTIEVAGGRFSLRNLSLPAGATLRWRFEGRERHNVTFANGPSAFASTNLRKGRAFAQRLTRPGTYRLFCSLHPVTMQQVVVVRPPAALSRRGPGPRRASA
jgi:plastocyanin